MKHSLLLLLLAFPVLAQPDAPLDDEAQVEDEKAAAKAALEAATQEKRAPKAKSKAKPAQSEAKSEGFGGEDDLPDWDDESFNETGPGAEMEPDWGRGFSSLGHSAFPWIETHGAFRLRADLFHQFHLNTFRQDGRATSPVAPPLTEREDDGFGSSSDSLAGANMRLRLSPTIHVSERLRVHTTLDILDNLVLGSTPDGGPLPKDSSLPLDDFRAGQRAMQGGINGYQDALSVERLWGEWRTPLNLLLIFGRMPSHFGLGIFNHSGDEPDSDFGESVDRIQGISHIFDTYVSFSWDFPDEGYVGYSGFGDARTEAQGQAHDFDQRDEITQVTLSLFDKPFSRKEQELRARALEQGRWAIDWAFQGIMRSRSYQAEFPLGDPPADETGFTLREVNSEVFIPDFWMGYEYRPNKNRSWKFQLEVVGIFGRIDELPQRAGEAESRCLDPTIPNIEDCPSSQLVHPREREIKQWGYALELDVREKELRWGFLHGIASGDEQEGFGILDQSALDTPNLKDDTFKNFSFHRGYTLDLILFRELIGGVTNAAYFKPYLGYDFVHEEDEAWGFTLSALYAFAMEKKATPGDESPLGLEFDAEIFIHEFDRFRWSAAYGILFPMGAFNLRDNGKVIAEPDVAQTIQLFLGMEF